MDQISNKVSVRGEITAKFYDQLGLMVWQKYLNKLLLRVRYKYPKLLKFYQLGRLKHVDDKLNVICNAGFNAITRLLTGDHTYSGEINKALLGTGVGTASASDTQLITEAYRNDIASSTDDQNIAYVTAFFSETECSGTYKEFGNVIDGSVSANTGRLWSHITGLNWIKDNQTVLVISCKYTFTSN